MLGLISFLCLTFAFFKSMVQFIRRAKVGKNIAFAYFSILKLANLCNAKVSMALK